MTFFPIFTGFLSCHFLHFYFATNRVYRFREVGDEVPEDYSPIPEDANFVDGTYRGVFADREETQVNVQFTLEDNEVTDIGYRLLAYDGVDYLEDEDYEAVKEQHKQAIEHLKGNDIREVLADLYEPGEFVDDIDGFSGATVYSNKDISAIVDALNRGVYRFREVGDEVPEDYYSIPEDVSFEDGTYRGIFADREETQVNVQFTLEDNEITDIGHRLLAYDGIDYLEDESVEAVKEQHKQVLDHLEGQDIREVLPDLYEPGEFVDDIDGFSGATVYSNKEKSAILDALNRGVYRFREVGDEVPEDYTPLINTKYLFH
ncbi:FMN-binding protein [Natranaerofaba carboxydovora]|uniref:FMN-binding protein n=1 Tax=Natranaerofaba carboxydovora TaxID=2742683 RepID=UPI001F12DF65|nr:FMN-binding protein [Natranaerofaba carboxydovora]UMZ72694.1 FMN-binding domain protein [Natranaerofaba carboxydovora]